MTLTSSPVRGLEDVTVTAPVPGNWVEGAVCEVTILNTDFRVTEELVLGSSTGEEGTATQFLVTLVHAFSNILLIMFQACRPH